VNKCFQAIKGCSTVIEIGTEQTQKTAFSM